MAAPKPKDWKVIIFYIDPLGNSRDEMTENITEATAKSRATAMSKAGCWTKTDAHGARLLVPPHRIQGIFIRKMEETDESSTPETGTSQETSSQAEDQGQGEVEARC